MSSVQNPSRKKQSAVTDRAMKMQEAHIRKSALTESDYAQEAFGDFNIADIINDTRDKFHFSPIAKIFTLLITFI